MQESRKEGGCANSKMRAWGKAENAHAANQKLRNKLPQIYEQVYCPALLFSYSPALLFSYSPALLPRGAAGSRTSLRRSPRGAAGSRTSLEPSPRGTARCRTSLRRSPCGAAGSRASLRRQPALLSARSPVKTQICRFPPKSEGVIDSRGLNRYTFYILATL